MSVTKILLAVSVALSAGFSLARPFEMVPDKLSSPLVSREIPQTLEGVNKRLHPNQHKFCDNYPSTLAGT